MTEFEKYIYDLHEKVKKEHPELSDKEVSTYVAGLVPLYGILLSRGTKGD